MELSIFLPCIRVHNLPRWYDSLQKSLGRHTAEVVICGPFEPPSLPNLHWIKSYSSPVVCAQKAALACSNEVIMTTVDDAIFLEDALERTIDESFWYVDLNDIFPISLESPMEVIGLRYREGKDFSGTSLPNYYWRMGSSYNLPYINPTWGNNCHFMMLQDLFRFYGGFDCSYQYLTHATADFLGRIQSDGVTYFDSPCDITTCDWLEGTAGNHAPIHFSQTEYDLPKFLSAWSQQDPPPKVIPLDTYKEQEEVWSYRFDKNNLPKTYYDLYPNEA